MKKIDFKFSKRQVILFTALIALAAFGWWLSGVLSSEAPKASVDSSKHVTEHVSEQPSTSKDKIATDSVKTLRETSDNVQVEQKTAETSEPEQAETTPVQGDDALSRLMQCYPTYQSANPTLFDDNMSKIISTVGENKIDVFIESHTRSTGLRCGSSPTNIEKSSFLRLIVNSAYNFDLSWAPWSSIL